MNLNRNWTDNIPCSLPVKCDMLWQMHFYGWRMEWYHFLLISALINMFMGLKTGRLKFLVYSFNFVWWKSVCVLEVNNDNSMIASKTCLMLSEWLNWSFSSIAMFVQGVSWLLRIAFCFNSNHLTLFLGRALDLQYTRYGGTRTKPNAMMSSL